MTEVKSVQEKLAAIQVDRAPRYNRTIANVATEQEVMTIKQALEKWESDPIAKVEILEQLQDYPEYNEETHEVIAELASKFDTSDMFIQLVTIGPREANKGFLHNDKLTYAQFHLKYNKSGDLYDFYDFCIRVVAQKGFAESQRLSIVARLDLQVLETPVKKAKKA